MREIIRLVFMSVASRGFFTTGRTRIDQARRVDRIELSAVNAAMDFYKEVDALECMDE